MKKLLTRKGLLIGLCLLILTAFNCNRPHIRAEVPLTSNITKAEVVYKTKKDQILFDLDTDEQGKCMVNINLEVEIGETDKTYREAIFLSCSLVSGDGVLYCDGEVLREDLKIYQKGAHNKKVALVLNFYPKEPKVDDYVLEIKASDHGVHQSSKKVAFKVVRKLDEKEDQGRTALHRAVEANKINTVISLIELGVDVNLLDDQGKTALYKAVENSRADIVEQFLQTGMKGDKVITPKFSRDLRFDIVDSAGNNILHKAFWLEKGEEREKIVKLLFDYFTFYGSQVLDTLKNLFQSPNNPPLPEMPVLPMEIAFMDNPDYQVCSLLSGLVRDIYLILIERYSDKKKVKKILEPVFRRWTYVGNTRDECIITEKFKEEENDKFNQHLRFIHHYIGLPPLSEWKKYLAEQEVKIEENRKRK